jgi:AraC-like DNA-binding protein
MALLVNFVQLSTILEVESLPNSTMFVSAQLKPPLTKYVVAAFYLKYASCHSQHMIVPDGKASILINLNNDKHSLLLDGAVYSSKQHIFLGLHSQAAVCTYGESTEVIVVRFHPFALWSLVGIEGYQTMNRFGEASDLFKQDFTTMVEQCKLLATPELKLNLVLRYFEQKIPASLLANTDLLTSLQSIDHSKGLVTVAELTRSDAAKHKKLQRLFLKTTGMMPKVYARQVRFDNIQQHLRQTPKPDWFQVVAHYGFTDQSHLIKEFLALTNHSPKEYINKEPGYFI